MKYLHTHNVKIEQEFYASINSIESIDASNVQIVFDGVLTSDFESVSTKSILHASATQVYERIFPHLIILEVEKDSLNEIIPFSRNENFIGKWFLLKTTNIQTPVVASLFIEDSEFPEESTTFIYSIDLLN